MTTKAPTPKRKAANTSASRKPSKFPLQPAMAKRLMTLLAESRLPKSARVSYLCAETGRTKQTVHRWLSTEKPGSPDLESFALICALFQIDANWMLGLTKERYPGPTAGPLRAAEPTAPYGPSAASIAENRRFVDDVAQVVGQISPQLERVRMAGDEMEPRILDGALVYVDTSVREITGNGVYVLGYRGKRIIRTVEQRLGEGIALICENKKYKELVVPDDDAVGSVGLEVIGKVPSWLQLIPA